MRKLTNAALTRREFAKRAAFAGAAATLVPAEVLPQASAPTPPPPSSRELPPASKSEADSRVQTILALYANRFSESQVADLRKISASTQSSLDRLRAYKVENSSEPGLYLKPLVEREKKPATATPVMRPKPAPAKP
jgi:hypothetical protein